MDKHVNSDILHANSDGIPTFDGLLRFVAYLAICFVVLFTGVMPVVDGLFRTDPYTQAIKNGVFDPVVEGVLFYNISVSEELMEIKGELTEVSVTSFDTRFEKLKDCTFKDMVATNFYGKRKFVWRKPWQEFDDSKALGTNYGTDWKIYQVAGLCGVRIVANHLCHPDFITPTIMKDYFDNDCMVNEENNSSAFFLDAWMRGFEGSKFTPPIPTRPAPPPKPIDHTLDKPTLPRDDDY